MGESIIIGCDHAAYDLKLILVDFLEKENFNVKDAGTNSSESVNYPDYAKIVSTAVIEKNPERGILLCGTGLGMSMAANRNHGIRAALCNDVFSAKMSRLHNDSNILVMGARVVGDILAMEIVKTWLYTGFEGGRHQSRLDLF
ncbi:MAG: ribose 5-phosphate isomerase B [Deltaproteobacteria bacterium]|nr:MAG: ribose 5-phosphate isomerase B [Deltaproteobacteria bacterium]